MKEPFLKRPFDFLLSLTGIILSSPLWLLIGLLIMIEDGWPIFYTQERVGRYGNIFKAIKFRSMIKNAEKDSGPVQAVENDPRITKAGKILRATAMDELPQLVNILKGDMSFVGPRSLRPKEKEVYGNPDEMNIDDVPGYNERLAVRPGLTGIAQVYLPTDARRKEKFQYDLDYIRNQSFFLDLKLIILSFWITFRGKWQTRQQKL
jgi:lipopolysaccharide/colanic/teichoic acid biosynthesis glycosyltransferase